MFEVPFSKDVRKYKEKIFMGMTWKQLFFVALGFGSAVPTYIYGMKKGIPEDVIAWVAIIMCAFFVAFGFFTIDGMTFGQYMKAFYETNFVRKRKRAYARKTLDECLLEEELDALKEELKVVDKQLNVLAKKKL